MAAPYKAVLHAHTAVGVDCKIVELIRQIDPTTRQPIREKIPFVKNGDMVVCRIQNLSGFEEIGAAVDESTITEQISGRSGGGGGGGNRKKRRQELAPLSEDESKLDSTSSGNEMNDNDGKLWESRNVGSKTGGEESSRLGNKPPESTQPSEPPPKQDYIHVRARRGQATDSHSLAERVVYLSSYHMQFWL